jgi:integrase/recombinase XerD
MRVVERYLSLRRIAGFKLDTVAYRLRSFARFAAAKGEPRVRGQTAVEWAALAPSPLARHNRLHTVIRFVRYVRVEDPAHELPAGDHFCGRYTRRPPYIFSRAEIRSLLHAAERLEPTASLRPATFKTLIGLLAATGLRLSEARGLHLDDVRREDRSLFVRRGKCGKSRLIPLHASTLAALDQYIAERQRRVPGGSYVFVTSRGAPLPKPTVIWTFARLRRCLTSCRSPTTRLPRLHDLRHTFAVRALEACPGEGRDRIGRHIQAIAQYLGHSQVTFTYWYFESTPALMKDMADAARALVEGARP